MVNRKQYDINLDTLETVLDLNFAMSIPAVCANHQIQLISYGKCSVSYIFTFCAFWSLYKRQNNGHV